MTQSKRLPWRALCAFGLLACAWPVLAPGMAKAEQLTSRYNVSLIGLPVGRASFDTTISEGRYSVKGTLASAGLADIVSKTSGSSSVAGTIKGGKLYATRYGLDYSSDKKTYRS
ncbi:MAG: DUF3108 domain-containing protein, partial [Rhizobiaceae bacterium]|nr:DUF3108 domain-containing protein [Rhizobiaceae bacterium]